MKKVDYAYRLVEQKLNRRTGELTWVQNDPKIVLPYGAYIEGDGAIVVFDRDYKPISRCRKVGARREPVSPNERIKYVNQLWFYDGQPPGKKVREYLMMQNNNPYYWGKW